MLGGYSFGYLEREEVEKKIKVIVIEEGRRVLPTSQLQNFKVRKNGLN